MAISTDARSRTLQKILTPNFAPFEITSFVVAAAPPRRSKQQRKAHLVAINEATRFCRASPSLDKLKEKVIANH